MKKMRSLALVGAGPVSRSFVARLPVVGDQLGPIKSHSVRLASRIANSLRAGFPVAGYGDLEHCRVILLSVPPALLNRVVAEMAAAPVDWRRKSVLLCDDALDSRTLLALAARGAAIGSLAPLDGFDERRLLIEGDRAAVAAARRLLAGGNVRLVELRHGGKTAYRAGLAFLSVLAAPLLSSADDCLRIAGISATLASEIIRRISGRTLRAYLKAGRKSWTTVAPLDAIAALDRLNPDLAASYSDASRVASRAQRRTRLHVAAAS